MRLREGLGCMPKKQFEVGQRVKVFCHLGEYKGTVEQIDVASENRYRHAKGLIRVRGDNGEIWTQHPKQCVRLKKKVKPPVIEHVTASEIALRKVLRRARYNILTEKEELTACGLIENIKHYVYHRGLMDGKNSKSRCGEGKAPEPYKLSPGDPR